MRDKYYISIDGTCLLFQVLELRRKKVVPAKSKLNLDKFVQVMQNSWDPEGYRMLRAVCYFKQNDDRIDKLLKIPDFNVPGQKNRLQIEECGINIKDTLSDKDLLKLPTEKRDVFPRGEKGLDIQLTCDALTFISTGKISSIALLVNDRDYVPLFKSAQLLGANIYLSALHSKIKVREELIKYSDRYIVFDDRIDYLFDLDEKKIEKKQKI